MCGLGMNNWNNVKGKKKKFVQLLESQYINGFSLGNGQLVINVFPNSTLVFSLITAIAINNAFQRHFLTG